MQRATAHEVRRSDPRATQVQKTRFKKAMKGLRQRVREKQGED
jgi:hypothetical protein